MWQIELFFKVLKSQMSLDVQTSTAKHRVELKMWATLLGLALKGRMCEQLLSSYAATPPNSLVLLSFSLHRTRMLLSHSTQGRLPT